MDAYDRTFKYDVQKVVLHGYVALFNCKISLMQKEKDETKRTDLEEEAHELLHTMEDGIKK